MSTADRIAALRAEGEAAVAAATATAELEEVRVRFLGRKAELPNLLRDVGKLPPEERGPVGKGANEARKAIEAAVEDRRAQLEAAEDWKSTRLNSSHSSISYAVFCLKKKNRRFV